MRSPSPVGRPIPAPEDLSRGEGENGRASERRQRRRPKAGGVTAVDVAALAGVSVASVSRVLNGSGNVGSAVRQSVLDASEELGYQPHAAARALASRRSRIIGVVVPTIENPNFAKGVETLQRHLAAAGYTTLLASSGYDAGREAAHVRTLVAHGVDGVMLIGGKHQPDLLAFLDARNIPHVNAWVLDGRMPSVGFDNQQAAYRAASYLLDLGHRDIGVIAGLTKGNDRAAARVAGIRQALSERGLGLPQERLIERSYRIVDGQIGLRALLEQPRRPTAIICGNDVLAFGALLECQARGITVPQSLSICGFDDLEFASQLQPPLTTIRIPADEIGTRAAECLLSAIDGRTVPRNVEVPISLVVRGSTAPPGERAANL